MAICFWFLKFWSWIFEKSSKFWAASCKYRSNLLLIRITVCLESFLPIGWYTFIWWKNPRTVLLYFGLDCRMMKFFTLKPQSKEKFMSLPNFRSTVLQKRWRFEDMQTVTQISMRIRGLFAWSWLELGSCFKYSALKLKNQKHIAVDVRLENRPWYSKFL